MADLADVETALKSAVLGLVYPNGTSSPSAIVVDSTPVPTKIGRGWPLKTTLQSDLAAGVANISIFNQPGMDRNTTRFEQDWETLIPATTTLTTSIAGQMVTFGGTVAVPQNIGVVVGKAGYAYAVQANDTLTTIAANIAALIPGASSTGPALTVPGTQGVIVNVGGVATLYQVVATIQKPIQITLWCPTPEGRDAAAKLIAPPLSALKFLTLADGTAARVIYQRTMTSDGSELSGLFRRDLFYLCEWNEIITLSAPQAVLFETVLEPNKDGVTPLDTITLFI